VEDRFARVAVIGTGMMGPGMALTFALGGSQVTMVGRSAESIERGYAGLDEALAFLVRHGLLASEQAPELRDRIRGTATMEEAVIGAGLVHESVVERLETKQELFARLEELTNPGTILTSNTSGLRISDIAVHLQRPERAATLHFWFPAHLMPLVEITQGEHTSGATVDSLVEYLRRCGKAPVVARKDVPGQVANRLQHALFREATYMVQEGIASAADVDLALKMGPGRRWPVYGVLEHHDIVGIDLGLNVQRSLVPGLCRSSEPVPLLQEKVNRGEVGVKTGTGFYDWSHRDADALKERRDAFLCMLARDWPED